jgi:hypothetical protein
VTVLLWVARFFLVKCTKTWKCIPNHHSLTKWPQNRTNGRKIFRTTKNRPVFSIPSTPKFPQS